MIIFSCNESNILLLIVHAKSILPGKCEKAKDAHIKYGVFKIN